LCSTFIRFRRQDSKIQKSVLIRLDAEKRAGRRRNIVLPHQAFTDQKAANAVCHQAGNI
jgi:hypothetical protein